MWKIWLTRIAKLFWGYNIFLILIGSYRVDFFDTALNWLSLNYSAMGLTMYRDFSTVYPPALLPIIGGVLHINSPYLANAILIACYIPFVWLLIKQRPSSAREPLFWLAQVILLRTGAIAGVIAILAICIAFSAGPTLAFAMIAILPWIRWDWGIFFVILSGIVVAVERESKRMRWLLATASGYLVGLVTLGLYLYGQGVLVQAWDLIVKVPLLLSGSYRKLPIPITWKLWHSETLVYTSIIGTIYLAYKSLRTKNLWPLVLVGTFVPYGLGRVDFGHNIAWMFAQMLVYFEYANPWRLAKIGLICLALCVLPIAMWLVKFGAGYIPRPGNATENIANAILDCQKQSAGNFGSIFVGHESYDMFRYNLAALYLTHPTLPPASRYISDEPGIQNSCEYGEVIANELSSAPKPILIFLEKGLHTPENIAMMRMTNCGKIEQFLENRAYQDLGVCKVGSTNISVRVYP